MYGLETKAWTLDLDGVHISVLYLLAVVNISVNLAFLSLSFFVYKMSIILVLFRELQGSSEIRGLTVPQGHKESASIGILQQCLFLKFLPFF